MSAECVVLSMLFDGGSKLKSQNMEYVMRACRMPKVVNRYQGDHESDQPEPNQHYRHGYNGFEAQNEAEN